MPSDSWKVCYEDYDSLTDLLNSTDQYPQHAYYDADYNDGCYCYDYCPNWKVYAGYRGATYLSQYVSPVILIIGVIGNLMILAMFQTKDLKRMPSRPFFQALAVTDNIALISGLLVWCLREGFGVEIVGSAAGCKLRVYATYVSTTASGWLVAALTIDRFVSVTWPMKANRITYKHRAMIIALLYTIFGLLYSHLLVYREYVGSEDDDYEVCDIDTSDYHYRVFLMGYFTWLELAFNFFVPFLVIVVCNIGMVNSMRKSEGTEMTSTKSDTQASKRITLLFIVIGTAFVVTVAPTNLASLCFAIVGYGGTWRNRANDLLISAFCRNFSYANNAINIFLYCIVGRKFRSALTSLLRCTCT